jgi:hypothetical protein
MRSKKISAYAVAINFFTLCILGFFWILFWPYAQEVTPAEREATSVLLGLTTIVLLVYVNTVLWCDRLQRRNEVMARLDPALFQLYDAIPQNIRGNPNGPFGAYFAWKNQYVRTHGIKKIVESTYRGTLPGMDDLPGATPRGEVTKIQNLIKEAVEG